MSSITTKTSEEIKIMIEGGKILSGVKKELKKIIKEGTSAWELEKLATRLIEKQGAKPSFKMVPGYDWTLCVNVNEGVVHGIPKKEVVFKDKDIVSVDMGVYYKGFHTDSSFSVAIGKDEEKEKFLKTGKRALVKAIEKVKLGNRIYDVSKAIEDEIKKDNLSPIEALVGHGIGRELHEDPKIPCVVKTKREKTLKIQEGHAFAIEVMYTNGKNEIVTGEDRWTIETKDKSLSGLFEETVVVIKTGGFAITA